MIRCFGASIEPARQNSLLAVRVLVPLANRRSSTRRTSEKIIWGSGALIDKLAPQMYV